ncbi:MAG TPA: amino acid adenylation domain-containing protein [Herpetosiphonaceae bacterium]
MSDVFNRISDLSEQKRALLARLLKERGVDPSTLPIPLRTGDRSHAELSFAQQRLWFLNQLEPDSPFYNVYAVVRLTGPLDVDALQRAVDAIVQRHEILRTIFPLVAGQAVQAILPESTVVLAVVDLLDPATLMQAVRDEILRPFDLSQTPPLRARLLRLHDQDHVLILTLHHIITDGWAMKLFIRELTLFYHAFTTQATPAPPELPIQYADFAIWQRQHMQAKILEDQLAYWRAQLADLPTVDLPTDHPRPVVQTFRGARRTFAVPQAISARLAALAQAESATLFMTLLAAFDVLLARYSSQDEIVVGSPIAGRQRAESINLIGCFINTLILRADLSGNPSFRQLLGRVRQTCLGAYAHGDLPFEKLVEELHPARDLSHNPLFQIMFILQDNPASDGPQSEIALEALTIESETTLFDLTLSFTDTPAGLMGALEYNTDLFAATTAERLIGHLLLLLEHCSAAPDTRIDRLPLLTPAEQQQILSDWNATATDYPQLALHELFADQVARTPDAIAVLAGAESLTYAELDRRANQLARHLLRRGVGPESCVAICLPRSPELVIGVIGVLKAGAAYLPLDPNYPAERLQFMLADTGASLLLTHERLRAQLPLEDVQPAPVLCLDRDWERIAAEPGDLPPVAVDLDQLAYVIYTSGSTGQPKGVGMTQRPLLNLISWQLKHFALPGSTRTLQFAPLSFDVSFQELLTTLCGGGTLILIDEEQRRDSVALLQHIDAMAVERVFLPFVAVQALAEAAQATQLFPQRLREIVSAGEQLQLTEAIQRFVGALDGCVLTNQYGPSESHVVSAFSLSGAPAAWPALPPIGYPIQNARLYLLDRSLQPVPVGVHGELYIGGECLARGYLNRPDLTAERFLPDPFNTSAGSRLYRTGDIGRFLLDGAIAFVGRSDQQVKVRGFRIEPGEIEALLRRAPGVQDAAVVAQASAQGMTRLVAYVVGENLEPRTKNLTEEQRTKSKEQRSTADSPSPAAQEWEWEPTTAGKGEGRRRVPSGRGEGLRAFLQSHLPEYMIPAAFVPLDALPLTPSGKLDRRALLLPEWTASGGSDASAAPRTPDEELLQIIWSDVLHIDAPGIHDNFFDLGGHSLLAMQVATRVRALFQVMLPLRQMFESPTIAGLARYLAVARSNDQTRQAPPLMPATRPDLIPLSFAQQRLWFMSQLQPDSSFYTIPAVLRLDGPLDPAALARSFQAVVRRHEVLRTSFGLQHGQPHQVIAPELELELPLIDLRDLPLTERESEAQRRAAAEIARPFDLARGPLWRASLLRLDDTTHLLVLALHHILADGWSLGLLIAELSALYSAEHSGTAAVLPPLPIQYADYALWQRAWMQGDVLAAQLDYWRSQLGGAPPLLDLPTDRPRPPIQTFHGATHPVLLPEALVAGLRAVSRREGTTLFMTLLAGFQTLLARYSGQDDILVGSPIAGRTQAAAESLIGCFINTLVLRADLAGNPPFRALLAQVRERCLGAYAHGDLPFEQLVEALAVTRDLSAAPLVQVMFALHNLPVVDVALDDLAISSLPLANPTVKVDLTLSLHETTDGLAGGFEYNSDLFDAVTIAQMSEHLLALLAQIAANPGRRVYDLPLLTAQERTLILHDWNATLSAQPSQTLPEVIAAQAARTPESIALRVDRSGQAETERLSYAALEARSNQLAHYLRRLGMGKSHAETRVGLCLSRSPDLVVAALGVLKAGAAYLPLDPNYPAERLQYMLHDAGVSVLLTEAQLAQAVTTVDVPIVRIDGERQRIAAEPTTPLPPPDPDQLAYLIYTSGSTGRPKGVQIPHRALANFLLSMAQQPGLTAEDTLLAVTTLSFDIAGLELWLPLIVGAQLVLAPREVVGDGAQLAEHIAASAASVVQATPATWQLLLRSGWSGSERLTILCGGESLPRELADQLLARSAAVWNMYGPTETTIWSTIQHLAADAAPISIGRPIANTQIYILDRSMQPVPLGVAGELYIGGLGLARGYRNRPELTAEQFVPSPFGQPGARLYKTGDRARYRRDGTILLLGRSDRQIKLHGHRIELEEIEATLLEHSAVAAAAVIVREDRPGDQRLVAYVVGEQKNKETRKQRENLEPRTQNLGEERENKEQKNKETKEQTETEIPPRLPQRERGLGGEGLPTLLRSFLRTRLPSFMVPSAFVLLPELPRTPNGKLDRRALPVPEQRIADRTAYVAPTSELERTIASLWQDVLHLDKVSIHDNFFDLGGDSFRMAELHSRLRERISQPLLLIELFEHPTIQLLARHLSRSAAPDAAVEPDRAAEKLAAGKNRLNRQLQQRRAAQPPSEPPDDR